MIALSWWALALRGVLAVIFGILALKWPGLTIEVLVLLFGANALVDGVLALIAAFRGSATGAQWWGMLLQGILGVVTGIIVLLMWGTPLVAVIVYALVVVIAVWAIIIGIFEIAAAVRLRKEIQGEWLLALRGVLAIIFGVVLLMQPLVGALAVVWVIGVFSIALGLVSLILAFRLRSHQHRRLGHA